MDAQERLTREEALAPTLIGSMHVHRYTLAAELSGGLRVADIGCGTGYGSEILARESALVVGVDLDEETIRRAEQQLGKPGRLEFEVADAGDFLRERLRDRFDAIVMLETLEHLDDIDDVLTSLRRHAEDGIRIVVSVPNSRMLDEENPHHTFDFGYDEAKAAFAGFPDTKFVYQFLADGSVIQPEEPDDPDGRLTLGEPGEREYAQQFIALINFGERAEQTSSVMRVQADPLNQRYLSGLERANEELRRTNERLARGWRGVADSAAATLIAKAERLEEALAESQRELAAASQRRWTPEDERMIAGLHQEIADLNQTIADMQGTRAWRLASGYWSFKRLFRPGRGSWR